MVSEMSKQFRHLSAIREQAIRRKAAIQGTRTNPGEAECRFEQNVAMLVTCRIVCRGLRQSTCWALVPVA